MWNKIVVVVVVVVVVSRGQSSVHKEEVIATLRKVCL